MSHDMILLPFEYTVSAGGGNRRKVGWVRNPSAKVLSTSRRDGERLKKRKHEKNECCLHISSRRPPPVSLWLPSSSFADPQTGAPESARLNACFPHQRVCVFR